MEGLNALRDLSKLVFIYGGVGQYNIIEKELKDYYEIKDIAKHYHWEDLANDVYNVETDRKWQLKFTSAICDVQKDYHKARALDIIRTKHLDLTSLIEDYFRLDLDYSEYVIGYDDDFDFLEEEEYELLRKMLKHE